MKRRRIETDYIRQVTAQNVARSRSASRSLPRRSKGQQPFWENGRKNKFLQSIFLLPLMRTI